MTLLLLLNHLNAQLPAGEPPPHLIPPEREHFSASEHSFSLRWRKGMQAVSNSRGFYSQQFGGSHRYVFKFDFA
jgi:hypothetical protein